ncbi:uncharacterized protein LOC133210323 [Neopsephotus bourkii]|uniref:uncharacterized protein LOC133210323 n=1 Tax=Neopsephotus bourkii TaxID=309878 RepID=UPI002AA538A9|nr:uncharacterized protein LOC133210323 [Neopsephotus bourkii]
MRKPCGCKKLNSNKRPVAWPAKPEQAKKLENFGGTKALANSESVALRAQGRIPAELSPTLRTRQSPPEEHQPPARPCEPSGPPKVSEGRFRHNRGPPLPAGFGPPRAASGHYSTAVAGAGPASFLALCCHLAGSGRLGPAPCLRRGSPVTAENGLNPGLSYLSNGVTGSRVGRGHGALYSRDAAGPNPAGKLAPKSLGFPFCCLLLLHEK